MSGKEERSLKQLWQIFDKGDMLTDKELDRLMKNAQEGLTYLLARGERFVSFKTYLDMERIRSYVFWRKEK